MKQQDVFSLSKAMNELSKHAAPKLRFIIKQGKSVGVENRWVVFDTQYKEWVMAGENYMELKEIMAEWNKEEIVKAPGFQLVHSQSYSWYELTVKKLNKHLNNRNDGDIKLALRLVE
jgi:phage-related protein